MKRKIHEILCRECGVPLVVENAKGNLDWNRKHASWCPAKFPQGDGPARKAAREVLICGKNDCCHQHADIHSLGEQVSFCSQCPHQGLARTMMDHHVNKRGGKKPVEVILPAPRRQLPQIPLPLYTDALLRIHALEKKLKRRGG